MTFKIMETLQILSNGLYESTLHQVINNSPKFRVCVAYFYEVSALRFATFITTTFEMEFHAFAFITQPNFDASVEPLEMCVQRTGGTKNFKGAVYGEHLVSKVTTNFVKY